MAFREEADFNQGSNFTAWLWRSALLAAFSLIILIAYFVEDERGLLILLIGLLVIHSVAAIRLFADRQKMPAFPDTLAMIDAMLPRTRRAARMTACLVIQFDNLDRLSCHFGRTAQIEVVAELSQRLKSRLSAGDRLLSLSEDAMAVFLHPAAGIDPERLVGLAMRLQAVASKPVSLCGGQTIPSCSVGYCLGQTPSALTGRSLLDAAQIAADEARAMGPGAIRAYSDDMARRNLIRSTLRDDLEGALADGQIRPHFQPQIAMDNGRISGMEVLARWHHPERGCLSPAEFLPVIEAYELHRQLGETMLTQALQALSDWDRAGLDVPSVSINLSAEELRNPRLVDHIRWELDRFGLSPNRLTIEILETMIAESDHDPGVMNIHRLGRAGCRIDLDDFGTGYASISAIRRFKVGRIKIDRSFVIGADIDPDQQRLVSAIVCMADQLGLETLAEGVETGAEQSILAQLGCRHVQGFALAHPMPVEEATRWIRNHKGCADRFPSFGLNRI